MREQIWGLWFEVRELNLIGIYCLLFGIYLRIGFWLLELIYGLVFGVWNVFAIWFLVLKGNIEVRMVNG